MSEETQVQRRKKQAATNEERQVQVVVRRPSWRKQFRRFLTAPIRLARKYILRPGPARLPPPPRPEDDRPRQTSIYEAVQVTKRRHLPCYFVFLGLSRSGKSTTISKLFNGERPNPDESDERLFKFLKNENVGQHIGLEIVDVPGFIGKNTVQQDAEIVTALSTYLKRHLPCRIPTVTFITASLDDNRFEGEQSDFTRMLKTAYLARNYITDKSNSNLVLLLTHSEKAKLQTDDIEHKVQRYQDAFSKVFPTKDPVKVIQIDNIRENGKAIEDPSQRYHNIIFDHLLDFAIQREERSLEEMVNWLVSKSKRFSISFLQEVFSTSALLPPRKALITRAVNALMSDHVLGGAACDSDDENESIKYEPYFIVYHTPTQRLRKGRKSKSYDVTPTNMLTLIPSGSDIVLADKTITKIEECLVGDKVLGMHPVPSVITRITRTKMGDAGFQGISLGTIYCTKRQDSSGTPQGKPPPKHIYMYQNDSFRLVNAAEANIPERSSPKTLYILEVDSDMGTVIVNGFPCFPQINTD